MQKNFHDKESSHVNVKIVIKILSEILIQKLRILIRFPFSSYILKTHFKKNRVSFDRDKKIRLLTRYIAQSLHDQCMQ